MFKEKIKIGPIDTLILFGGGILMSEFAKESIKRGIKAYVFAVKRHLDEVVNKTSGLTLKDALKNEDIPFSHVRDINNSTKLRSLVSRQMMGIGLGEAYTFGKDTIKLFKGRLFDFMPVRLPQYNGGAHFTWQILREDRIGCWNIQVINEETVAGVNNSGEILKTKEYKIPSRARIPEDYFKISHKEAIELFIEFLNQVQAGDEFKLVKLLENNSSYFPRLYTLRHGFIDWSWNAREIESFISSFDEPYAGSATFLNEKRVFLKNCKAVYKDGKFHPFISGIIYRVYNNTLFIAAKDGSLIAKKAFDEKGRDLIPYLKVGHRFYTPVKYLEEAMLFNAEYGADGLI